MRRLVHFLLLSILLVCGAEVGLRLLGYHGETIYRRDNTIIVEDSVLNWRYKPNTDLYFNNIVYHINANGFRGNIHQYEKLPGKFRIFVASDSVGFGTNVQQEDSYPELLERALNGQRWPVCVEVINYSLPNLSIKQKFHLVNLHARQYHVDLIVIDYVMEDIESESVEREERASDCTIGLIDLKVPCAWKESFKRSALLFFVRDGIERTLHAMHVEKKNHSYKKVESDYYQQLYGKEEKARYLKEIFSEIGRYQDETGIRVVMPIFPLFYDYSRYKWHDVHDRVLRLCTENQLTCVPLLDEFQHHNYYDLRVQRGDFLHSSVKANELAADAIARSLNMAGICTGRGSSPGGPYPQRY